MTIREFITKCRCPFDYELHIYNTVNDTPIAKFDFDKIPDSIIDSEFKSWELDLGLKGVVAITV